MTETAKLKVAEHFYSIQGEGPSAGKRAVFLRLSMCMLECKWCDTLEVWKQGTFFSVAELVSLFLKEGYVSNLREGARLIITGGDPLIQQKALVTFLSHLGEECRVPSVIEVETEGVIKPDPELVHYIDQWNVSLKTSNSGMPESRRIIPDTIYWHRDNQQTFFKMVVGNSQDLNEVQELVEKFNIHKDRVWLMPLASSRSAFLQVAPLIASFCKDYGYNFSTRLHLLIWDQATGV